MIDVLTLVKNREDHLRRLAEGLRRSATPPAHLVIVDMSDAPVAAPACGCPVTVIRHATEGLPLARARNLAAAAARSQAMLFLDVDCIPSSGLVGAMADALSRREALICAPVLYLAAGDAQEPWTEAALLAAGQPHPARAFPREGLRREHDPGLFWSLAFGISRRSFDRLGGFDERFTGYGGEDTDFGFAARRAGIDLLFLGGPVAFHQHHGVIDPPAHHLAAIVRNAKLFFDKWGVWPMRGWLERFAALGFVAFDGTSLALLREPRESEIAALRSDSRRF